ncbi:MAG: ABC transporter permease [Bacteroidales bacterium]
MKSLMAFVRKEWWHVLRDRRTLVIIFAMPIVLMILFGYAINNEVKNISLSVYDPHPSELSRSIVNGLTSSGYVIEVDPLENVLDLEQKFRRKLHMALIFPDNFDSDFRKGLVPTIQLLLDGSDMNSSQSLVVYTRSVIGSTLSNYQSSTGIGAELFRIDSRMLYNPSLKSAFMFVPSLLALIMLIVSAMMSAISIAREKESGSLRLLLVTPMSPITIIVGKSFPYLVMSVINSMVIIVMSNLIFDMPIRGSYLLLSLLSLLFIVMAIALGIFIGLSSPSQEIAVMVSILSLFLPTTLLSGFIFPIENMPLLLQGLAQLTPARWFISALRSVLIRGSGVEVIWQELVVLALMAILFIRLSIYRFRNMM